MKGEQMNSEETTTEATPEATPATPTPAREPGPVLLDAACDVSAYASTDETRYVITGIHLTPHGVEATNGSMMVRVPYPETDPAKFPPTHNAPATCELGDGGVIVPAAAIKAAVKQLPKRVTLPVLSTVRVATEGRKTGVHAHLTTTDLDSAQTATPPCIEGRYPDVEQVIPKEEPRLTIALSSKLLAIIAEHAQKHGRPIETGGVAITLQLIDEFSGVRFSYSLRDGRRTTGVLMPVRLS